MAKADNKVHILGNVGFIKVEQIEKKDGSGSFSKAEFSIATSRRNHKDDRVNWIKCVAMGGLVDGVLEKYVHKGSKISVYGVLTNDPFTDKDGNKRSATYVDVEDVMLLDSKGSSSSGESSDSTDETLDDGELPPF